MKRLMQAMALLTAVMWAGSVLAASTHDVTVGGSTSFSALGKGKIYLFEKYLDCTPPSDGASPVSTSVVYTNGDTYQCLNIPAGSFVQAVGYEIVQGNDAAVTVNIGDGVNAAGYFSAASVRTGATARACSSAAYTNLTINAYDGAATNAYNIYTGAGTTAYGMGKFYSSADTIDVVIGTANATQLRLKVRALVVPIATSTSQ